MDLALEDIIKQNKTKPGGRRGRGSGRRRGGGGQIQRRSGGGGGGNRLRTTAEFPSRTRNVPDGQWAHDRFDDDVVEDDDFFEDDVVVLRRPAARLGTGRAMMNSTTKLLISNLDFAVSDGDINELFSEFGPLRRAAVHYEKSGRSLGTADVVFERRADAMRAVKQYNGVPLDGRAMKIQIVGANEPQSNGVVGARSSTAFGNNRMRGLNDRVGNTRRRGGGDGPGGNRGAGRGSRGGGVGAGRARGGGAGAKKSPMTQEELDADLDAYINKME